MTSFSRESQQPFHPRINLPGWFGRRYFCLTDSSWADSANDTGASGFSQSRPRRVFPFGHSPYGTSTRRRPQLDFFDLILFYLFHTFPNDPVTPR